MSAAILIPARMEASRLPGKPLKKLLGEPLLYWVLDSANQSKLADLVAVVTDSEVISDWCQQQGVAVFLDRKGIYRTGSDRLAAAVKSMALDMEVIVNLQCDEPEIDPDDLDNIIDRMVCNPIDPVLTLACPLRPEDADNPNVVKVAVDRDGLAMTFSRQLPKVGEVFQHVGIYGYQADAIQLFAAMDSSPSEERENLEQLRLLDNGIPIRVESKQRIVSSVNTEDDLKCLSASWIAATEVNQSAHESLNGGL